ncbi:MAG: hypothetical protein QOG53_2414 [Frankiales bacterium]|jgi:hypothetical protein|nr:hypothetical protein [Frankiales bacterium]
MCTVRAGVDYLGMDKQRLRLVSDTPENELEHGPVVPIRLLLALSGRCDCVECCARELARRAGREWVHPDLREARGLRAVR